MPDTQVRADIIINGTDNASATLAKVNKSLGGINESVANASKSTVTLGKRIDSLQPTFQKLRNYGAVAFGAVSVGVGVAVKAASDLNESVNAIDVVFGEAAEGVLKLGENSAKAVGLSRSQFYGLSVQMSSFAKTVTKEGGSVADTLDKMTVRVADFASVMNLDVSEAATAFQSGLAGQTEPLRKFGIDLSAASVQAYAVANGIAEAGKQMTETQRIQATYGSLMEQTNKVSGDFANTSGQLANQQRILKAQVEDLSAKLGTLFLPAMNEALKAILPVVTKLSEMLSVHPKLTVAVIATTAALAGMVAILGTVGTVLPAAIKGLALFSAGLKLVTGQATLLAAGLAALPLAITIGVALVGFAVVMKQISELKRETEAAGKAQADLENMNQKAIARAKELREAGDEEGAERLLNTVRRNAGLEARASGGPVSANRPYLVGETGPELFVPRNGGDVLPNGSLTGKSFTFNFFGDVNDKDALKREIIDAINRQFALAAT